MEIKDEDQCEDSGGTIEGVEGVSPGVFTLVEVEHQAPTLEPYVGCQQGDGLGDGQIITILGWD